MTSGQDVLISRQFAQAWQIYDEHRDSLFNCMWFETKLTSLQRTVLTLEVLIVIGTSTTGIAGWAFWNQPGFANAWAALAGIAVTTSLLKPIFKLDDRLTQLAKLYAKYARISNDYKHLVRDVASRQNIDDEILVRHKLLRSSTDEIEAVPQRSERLRERVREAINREWPIDKYWSPGRQGPIQ